MLQSLNHLTLAVSDLQKSVTFWHELLGLTLQTKPEEIYRALLEATAFGTMSILETFESAGLNIDRLVACGGLPEKIDCRETLVSVGIQAKVADSRMARLASCSCRSWRMVTH